MRKPETPKPSTARKLKTEYKKAVKKAGERRSMKQYMRDLNTPEVEVWFFNKRANFSKPPQGIGNTRR